MKKRKEDQHHNYLILQAKISLAAISTQTERLIKTLEHDVDYLRGHAHRLQGMFNDLEKVLDMEFGESPVRRLPETEDKERPTAERKKILEFPTCKTG